MLKILNRNRQSVGFDIGSSALKAAPVRELSLVRWRLIPSWAKDSSGAARMIDARSEMAATKPAFSEALKFCRCLIPPDGFYEWQKEGSAKQAYCFEINEVTCSRSRGYGRNGETQAERP